MDERTAENINILGRFCGVRDVTALTPEELEKACGTARADVMVLFGGSVLCGGDVLAEAMRAMAAERYMIVGGEGHTTQALRDRVHAEFPDIETAGLPEADVLSAYLRRVYGLRPDHTERRSTNCGNNITNMLAMLEENGVHARSIILCQDATMQRRMAAGLRKYAPEGLDIISFAAYSAEVVYSGGALHYARYIHGMWDIPRYVELLMGEIPRLTDDAQGYGPKGRGFIAHVDIPDEVHCAHEALKREFGDITRPANPLYAAAR